MLKSKTSFALSGGRRWKQTLTSALLPVVISASALASTYTWDPLLNGTGSDGAGTWSTGSALWATGTGDIAWPGAGTDIAKFGSGGTPGPVSVSGTVGVSSMLFDSAYSVSDGTITFADGSPSITTNANTIISSALSGVTATLTKAGSAKLTLNGATTGISAINVTAGTLATQVGGSGSFGSSSTPIVVSSGAAIQVASGATAANPITFNGGSGNAALIGGATLSGPITLASGDTKLSASNVAVISGAISGPGSLTLNGPNKVTLSGINSYVGGTTIVDGVIEVTGGSSFGTGPVSNGTNVALNIGTGSTVTISNAFSGIGSISKTGAGTAILNGTNTSTGGAIISAGTLVLNSSLTGASSTRQFVVSGGATLAGTGTVVGPASGTLTLLSGGILSPGDGGIGTFTATSISWTSNNTTASMFFDLSSSDSTCDVLNLSGQFARAATSGSYIFDFGGTGKEWTTYTLVNFGTTSSNSIANLVGINSIFPVKFSFTATSLKVTVVPEPSQVGIAFGLFAVAAILMRRKRDSIVGLVKGFMKNQLIKNAQNLTLAAILVAISAQTAGAKTVTVNLETATFDDLQAAMNAGAITSVEMATLYLNRRAVYDQAGIKINSVVSINPHLMDDAAAADEARSLGATGPLLGLLFCTKDSYPTKDMVTSGGVKSWLSSVTGTVGTGTTTSPITTEGGITYGPVIAPSDCFVVQKLKAAGAVQLGHGNMDTWATSAGSTTSNAYGTTLNAYCLGSASGSSGGPGALTGSDFANFAWGGETGGSIRNPSDRAGITGFKVTVGTNSVNNIIPLASDRDVVGPMARYVKDEAYIMDAAATVLDPDDLWAPINYVPGRGLSTGYATKATAGSLAGKVIGVVGTYLGNSRPTPAPTPVQLTDADVEKALGVGNGHGGLTFGTATTANTTGVDTPQSSVATAHNRLVAELTAAGATVVIVYLPPNLDTGLSAANLPSKFVDGVTNMPTAALGTTNPAVTSITGITTTSTTYANTTLALENRGFQLFHGQGIYTRLTQANAASGSLSTTVRGLAYDNKVSDFTVPAAVTHFQLKAIFNAVYEKFMDTAGPGGTPLDCLIWPVSFSKSRSSNSVSGRDLVNNMGLPVCTVPIGVYPELGGEPICEAFLGRYRKEADVLAVAAAYQKEYNHRIPSALSPPLDGETITYNDAGTLYQLRSDKLAPVVSVNTKAVVSDAKIVIEGIAADSGGIKSLRVYVNGRKIAAKPGKHWKASVPVSAIRKWVKNKAKSVDVTVLAKDKAGNASVTVKSVKI
ncbi:MAG: amidase family protein [Chthoniobacterales bacterium]